VIPNPVDSIGEVGSRDEFFRQRPELAGSPLVVFLSRIDRKKGIDLLIPAFRKVLERFAKAKLLMAGSGDGEYEQEMRRKTQELGIAGSVEWLGFTDGAAKRNLFAAADLFVLPSYSENFGVAVIEAMAAGLPVVVTDQVGICGFVEKERAGLVVECDVEQIAGAIGRVLASEERQEMGRRAAAAATAFTPARVASQVAEMYSTILRERASQ
jgi:glycosyltransferase involved in cell wall biosynthesis